MSQRLPSPERFAFLKRNLETIQRQVREACIACHRHPEDVCIVAASKNMPASDVFALYQLGHRHFGENYVQEMVEKSKELPTDICWHFIGHLQSNKVKLLVQCPHLYLLQTVDSFKVALKLNQCVKDPPLPVLLQINTSKEETKSGVEDASELYRSIVSACPHLTVKGVMTIGTGAPEEFDRLVSKQVVPNGFLSMGMTQDFTEAIRRGSTHVRIGRAIFGDRVAATDMKKEIH